MSETEKRDDGRSKTKPIIAAAAAGVAIAVAIGLIINSTMPRNTYASDVLHPPQSVTVTIPPNSYDVNSNPRPDPQVVRVVLGVNNTVIWVNTGEGMESISGEDESISFGKVKSLIQPGESWSFTFTEKGRYDYFSYIHPWFRGTVIVEEKTGG
jgi:plastocyanin